MGRNLLVLSVVIILVSAAPAYAQPLMDAGMITPNHGILYKLDVLLDNFRLMLFPHDPMVELNIMNERLAEYQMTNNTDALNDYLDKMSLMERDLTYADNQTRSYVENCICWHVEVLKEVKEICAPQAKHAIEHAINESSRVIKKIQEVRKQKKEHRVEMWINAPTTADIGEKYKISWRICNPFRTDINAVQIDAVVKKKGFLGFFIKKHILRAYNIKIPAGSCYSGETSVKVPESFWGIPLKGSWEVDAKIRAIPQNEVVEEVVKDVAIV